MGILVVFLAGRLKEVGVIDLQLSTFVLVQVDTYLKVILRRSIKS